MLIQENDNGTIYKLFLGGGFLNVKQAFKIDKICFEFGKYDSPQSKKLKETISYYLSIEDAAYFAYLCQSGKMFSMCARAKQENQYGSGFLDMAGVKTSKQIKMQMGDSQGKYFFKALEGPGEKTEKGLMKPKYNDQTADKKIAIAMTCAQIMTMGIAIQRAISILDMNIARGKDALESFIDGMKFVANQREDNIKGKYKEKEPEVKKEPATQKEERLEDMF